MQGKKKSLIPRNTFSNVLELFGFPIKAETHPDFVPILMDCMLQMLYKDVYNTTRWELIFS